MAALSVAAVILLLVSSTAHADAVKDRLDALENTIKTFQADSIARNEKVASALAAIDRIKQEYQAIQGTADANSHLIQQQQAELARLKRDISDRILAIEERLELYDMQITKAVAKVLPQAASEAENYQKALDLVQKSDLLTAVASFRTFLKTYPKSELADNAQYWIGECYFALKDYPKAIKEFQTLVEKYPKSDRMPNAILKQGLSFAEMGMNSEAKVFLNKVIKDYPGLDEAVRARDKIDRLDQKSDAASANTASPAGAGEKGGSIDSTSHIPLAPGVDRQPARQPGGEAPPSLPKEGGGQTR